MNWKLKEETELEKSGNAEDEELINRMEPEKNDPLFAIDDQDQISKMIF